MKVRESRKHFGERGYFRAVTSEGRVVGVFTSRDAGLNFVNRMAGVSVDRSCVFIDDRELLQTIMLDQRIATDFALKGLIERIEAGE